jgi:hypothetical protein
MSEKKPLFHCFFVLVLKRAVLSRLRWVEGGGARKKSFLVLVFFEQLDFVVANKRKTANFALNVRKQYIVKRYLTHGYLCYTDT